MTQVVPIDKFSSKDSICFKFVLKPAKWIILSDIFTKKINHGDREKKKEYFIKFPKILRVLKQYYISLVFFKTKLKNQNI